MAIHFTTNADGNNTEGIGAMAQYQIACYILSKLYRVNFYFEGFRNLTHYQYFDITQSEWCDSITNFFNFDISKNLELNVINFSDIDSTLEEFINANDNVIINFEPHYLLQFMDEYIDLDEVKNICEYLKNNISLSDDKKYFQRDVTNVAFHIRKYTQTDCDPNPRRELFDNSRQLYVMDLIKSIDEYLKFDNKIYHTYSQGNESEFEFLQKLKLNIKLHIEEHPLVSLYHMINSDVLITSNSSFSYVAHLLGNQKMVFVRDTFFNKWKNSSIKINL